MTDRQTDAMRGMLEGNVRVVGYMRDRERERASHDEERSIRIIINRDNRLLQNIVLRVRLYLSDVLTKGSVTISLDPLQLVNHYIDLPTIVPYPKCSFDIQKILR